MSIGKEIVKKSKSPFSNDEHLAKMIDFAIEKTKKEAKVEEQERIETKIANMSADELKEAYRTCIWLSKGRL